MQPLHPYGVGVRAGRVCVCGEGGERGGWATSWMQADVIRTLEQKLNDLRKEMSQKTREGLRCT